MSGNPFRVSALMIDGEMIRVIKGNNPRVILPDIQRKKIKLNGTEVLKVPEFKHGSTFVYANNHWYIRRNTESRKHELWEFEELGTNEIRFKVNPGNCEAFFFYYPATV